MVMQVIAEQLRLRNSSRRYLGIAKVAGEQHKGDIANIVAVAQAWDVANF